MNVYLITKKIIDYKLALLAILLLWPVFLILIIIIKLDSKGTVFFKQKRIGKYRTFFYIYKFRTMRVDAPNNVPTHLLQKTDDLITRVGKFLRKTSLDELPQIINVLRGEMSFIGPRPALWNQNDLICEREKYGANDIYPGITGWAQINGRDELPIEVKAKLDGEYVSRMSFCFDMKILSRTLFTVLKREGIKEGGDEKSIDM